MPVLALSLLQIVFGIDLRLVNDGCNVDKSKTYHKVFFARIELKHKAYTTFLLKHRMLLKSLHVARHGRRQCLVSGRAKHERATVSERPKKGLLVTDFQNMITQTNESFVSRRLNWQRHWCTHDLFCCIKIVYSPLVLVFFSTVTWSKSHFQPDVSQPRICEVKSGFFYMLTMVNKILVSGKVKIPTIMIRPVTSLGHQEGRRVFWEGLNFFELCPIVANCIQHIFPEGRKIF